MKLITPYEDQMEVIDATREAMRAGHKAILLQSPTGSGKSVIAAYMAQQIIQNGRNSWFIVPRRNLLTQMHKTFMGFDIRHTYIAANRNNYNPHMDMQLCSAETLRRRLDKLKAPNVAFIDETHYGGNTLSTIIDWLKSKGVWIIGLSATPWLLSGEGLGCWYDHMVLGKSIRWLIDNERLSDYRAFQPTRVDLSKVRTQNGDYAKRDISEKMEQDAVLIGNSVDHYKKHAMGKLNIVFGTSVKHSMMIADEYRKAGIPARHIDGDTPEGERNSIIKDYADRKILVLTNCELCTFGFDLAAQAGKDVTIECMSDLRPTKSLALQMQKWGRVLRMKQEPALIFDHANNFEEHGFPCDDRKWTLQNRVKLGSGGGGERALPVKQCPKCFLAHRPRLDCPECGYLYPVESRQLFEVEGELTEIKKRQEQKKKNMKVGQCKTLDELRQVAQELNYKPAWVAQYAKAKGIKA